MVISFSCDCDRPMHEDGMKEKERKNENLIRLLSINGWATHNPALYPISLSPDRSAWEDRRVPAVPGEEQFTCAQIDVKLACKGFNSSITVDPTGVITPEDEDNALCTLNGGQSVHHGETATFNYVWSTKISFEPVSSTIECSEASAPAPSAV
ncbi:hypothetical protein VPH35_034808 [Triticum aestivum]|uniref:Uncharacterized protein n=1 Tax=Aegilops tauschii TaxID=37682 RepID=M8BXP2_AEGTA